MNSFGIVASWMIALSLGFIMYMIYYGWWLILLLLFAYKWLTFNGYVGTQNIMLPLFIIMSITMCYTIFMIANQPNSNPNDDSK